MGTLGTRADQFVRDVFVVKKTVQPAVTKKTVDVNRLKRARQRVLDRRKGI